MKVARLRRARKVGSVLGAGARGGRPRRARSTGDAPPRRDAAVDFTPPGRGGRERRALHSRRACRASSARPGWDDERDGSTRARARARCRRVFLAPNFAIGAVLMMRFAAEAARTCRARRSSSCTTRRRSTRRPGRRRRRRRRWRATADPLGAPARASSPTRRCSSAARAAADDPPRHALARLVRPGRAARARAAPGAAAGPRRSGLDALL